MNDLYNETIVRRGQTYRYDPDYDCYYRVPTQEDLTHWNRWSWMYSIVILAIVCYAVST